MRRAILAPPLGRGGDSRWRTWSSVCFLLAAVLLGAVLGPAGRATGNDEPSPGACTGGFSVIAEPTEGPVPLLVQFSVVTPYPSEFAYEWSFGDGATVGGTNGSEQALAHLYSSAGLYTATVYATGPNRTLSCSVGITATKGSLEAHVTGSPSEGQIPFTVRFSGAASNGTETYNEFLWDFGDGDYGAGVSLNYTYRLPGTYTVTLRVVDSSGSVAVATTRVAALSGPSSADPGLLGGGWSGAARLPFWAWGMMAAVASTGIGLLALRFVARGPTRPGRSERGTPLGAEGAVPASVLGDLHPAHRERTPVGGSPMTVGPGTRMSDGPTSESGVRPVPQEFVRLSQRIIGHLGRSGVLEREGTVRAEFTQKGMAQALQVRQGPLSNVLRRLVASGVLTEELRHVRGAPRRVKVYRLTSEGQALAAEMRRARAVKWNPEESTRGEEPPN